MRLRPLAVLALAAATLYAQDRITSAPEGWGLWGSKPASYQTGTETAEGGKRVAYLMSTVPNTGGFGTLAQGFKAKMYLGKRIRLRATVRSKDVRDWAGLWMRVDCGEKSESCSFDNMQNRAIKGTKDWVTYDVVLDVPTNATGIYYGILLSETGEVWMRDVSLTEVGTDVPTSGGMKNEPDAPRNLDFK